MLIFSATGDASGSPDVIRLPTGATGYHRLRIRPPAGHAWTLYDVAGNSYPMQMDEVAELYRFPRESSFVDSENAIWVSLDTGSGTFNCLLD